MQRPTERFGRIEKELGGRATERWLALAEDVHRASLGPRPDTVVPELESAAKEEAGTPLAPLFHLWAADALCRGTRDRVALGHYDAVLQAGGDQPGFQGIELGREAQRRKAAALARLGDVAAAVATYEELAARGERSGHFRAGLVADRAGRHDEAEALYRRVADQQRRATDADDLGQRALRAAERLRGDGTFLPSDVALAQMVETAVAARDADTLRRLASPTHLQAGPGGGHFRFEGPQVLEQLCEDLAVSRPRRMGRVVGTGRKRYLFTTGWRGSWFRGMVGFCFMRCGRGWEWTGLVVTGPAEPWLKRWEPTEKRTNQPLPFPLLAPWPEGRRFTAGGLPGFVLESAAITAVAFIPFIGGAIAAAMLLGFAVRDCGFGLRGFYYNEGPTHSGNDAFSIDFTAYRRGVPFDNVAGGTPVLSPADGVVTFTDADAASGDESDANEVQITHDDPATGAPGFISRYLHMAGPSLLSVSTGMPAPTGRRLGLMNDTGTSVLDHLHFSMHRLAAGGGVGPSVRPSPMEGRTLGDGDSGACIRSTNRERIVVTLPPGCLAALVEIFTGRR
jgi:hypothetical protein